MVRFLKFFGLAVIVGGLWILVLTPPAVAQYPVAVTAYYPSQPVLTYFPERRGLFGQRTVYRPIVTYATPAAPVRAAYYAPAAPVTSYAIPAAPVRSSYYAPPAPVAVVPAPVVVARPVAPVMLAPPPVVVARPVVPAIVAPAPVVPYYPPVFVP